MRAANVAEKTAHNGLYTLRRLTAAWPTKNRSRGLRPFVRFFSGTFCPPLKPLRGFFIAAAKTSHTAGTLCAICPKIYKWLLTK
jgi:hypothetical protein